MGDDVAESVESIRERIRNLRTPTECAHRHARGKEVGASLGYVLDSIETLVLPVDPKAAFRLLVAVFEADGLAIENCGDHDFEVSSAFERAAELMGEAGRGMLTDEVAAAVEALMADDGYGMGRVVAEAISNRGEDG